MTLAESDDRYVVEGNHYFPSESAHREYFADSATYTICSRKGEASYYHVAGDFFVVPTVTFSVLFGFLVLARGPLERYGAPDGTMVGPADCGSVSFRYGAPVSVTRRRWYFW